MTAIGVILFVVPWLIARIDGVSTLYRPEWWRVTLGGLMLLGIVLTLIGVARWLWSVMP